MWRPASSITMTPSPVVASSQLATPRSLSQAVHRVQSVHSQCPVCPHLSQSQSISILGNGASLHRYADMHVITTCAGLHSWSTLLTFKHLRASVPCPPWFKGSGRILSVSINFDMNVLAMAMAMTVSPCLISIIDSERSVYFNGGKYFSNGNIFSSKTQEFDLI